MAKEVIVILGTQLVPDHPALSRHPDATVLMIEADDICRKRPYHIHKLMLVLISMRTYADTLTHPVRYIEHKDASAYADTLESELRHLSTDHVIWMHASDRAPNRLLAHTARRIGAATTVYPNVSFLTSTQQFGGWLDGQSSKNPTMETFYRWQRRRLGILMNGSKPAGDTWNFDHDNRKPLPKKKPRIPPLPRLGPSTHTAAIAELMRTRFKDNPGSADAFWLPTSRDEWLEWLTSFVRDRLDDFGPFEDAMHRDEPFLYHSVISPALNIGMLTPQDCIDAALEAHTSGATLSSVEGFIRQVVGWREFMYGLYWWKRESFSTNFFGFTKPLEAWWYTNQGVPEELPEPVKVCLNRLHSYGYSHHIERLMVFGNWFLLNGYDPRAVYEWFSTMYVDAYEWVMVPNVLGMSQYADGGMLATKPYVSGGNYLQKMGRWWESDNAARGSEFTEKYWRFIYDNGDTFKNNHRMSLVVAQARKKYDD